MAAAGFLFGKVEIGEVERKFARQKTGRGQIIGTMG